MLRQNETRMVKNVRPHRCLDCLHWKTCICKSTLGASHFLKLFYFLPFHERPMGLAAAVQFFAVTVLHNSQNVILNVILLRGQIKCFNMKRLILTYETKAKRSFLTMPISISVTKFCFWQLLMAYLGFGEFSNPPTWQFLCSLENFHSSKMTRLGQSFLPSASCVYGLVSGSIFVVNSQWPKVAI